ncbi:MAG: hypothetical protein E1N59_2320 [Puniceicoccaceae bacterium 5H]|nr:MAG: hypothetical protein E1N59_2320 [Puniceicoccaceae bacterium 5H]
MTFLLFFAVVLGVGAFAGLMRALLVRQDTSARPAYARRYRFPSGLWVNLMGGICGAIMAVALSIRLFEVTYGGLFEPGQVQAQIISTIELMAVALLGGFWGIPMLNLLGALMLDRLEQRLDRVESQADAAIERSDASRRRTDALDLVDAARDARDDLVARQQTQTLADGDCEEGWRRIHRLCDVSLDHADNLRARLIRAQAKARLQDLAGALQDLEDAERLARETQVSGYPLGLIYWNLACYLSLAEREPERAVEALRQSIAAHPPFRADLDGESDLAWLRDQPAYKSLASG